jgi:hypothetical protein
MGRLRGVRPPPSMVIASLALLVALGGTSMAAVTLVIPRASVGLLQLKENSVNSSKVINGSLLRKDFRAGQLPQGPRGPRGLGGPAGPAGSAGPAGASGPSGAAGVAAPGYVAEVLTQTDGSTTSTTSESYTNVSNATQSVTVPSGETDKLVVFFSGESACYGGTGVEQCLLKITLDGTELSPAAGNDAFFDNNDLGRASPNHLTDDSFRAKSSGDVYQHGIVRTSGNVSAGSHTVQVQYSVTDSSVAFNLDDWALVVQRIKVS